MHTLKAPLPPSVRNALASYDELTSTLLYARGIMTEEAARTFFAREYETGLHDPFLLSDMEKAVVRILRAMAEGEKIGVYSDYDCDGIPGAALWHDFLTAIGYTNFIIHIPHRHEDGYGLNNEALDSLAKEGVTLLVTVDCGSTDVEQALHAKALGIDLIITDHHELSTILPDAYAIVNPKCEGSRYPFAGICGTGVAYKLITALISRGNFSLTSGYEKWFLDLVGLATIADMVPLVDENRIFAHYGLLVMRKGRRLGLQHLFRIMKMDAKHVTEDDIGFMIAPRINAASRMGVPRDAFSLLTAHTEKDAGMYARHLDGINNERKGMVALMVKEVKHKLSLRSTIDDVLVIGDPKWRPALVGLAANTLMEEYQRPVFVWGRDGREVLKGSCRSNGASVVVLMEKISHALLEYGGHHMAGGFAVKEEYIHTFGEMLNEAYRSIAVDEIAERGEIAEVDAVLSLESITPALVRTLDAFAPFGKDNAKPLFLFRAVTPYKVEVFGKQKAHTKIVFRAQGHEINAISFFTLPEGYDIPLEAGSPVDLVAHVEESFYGGRTEIRLRVVAVAPASL